MNKITIERQALADGFGICLLSVAVDRASDVAAYSATLFDGGRPIRNAQQQGRRFDPPADFFPDLRACLLPVLAPPHVLAVHGAGWRELLVQALPAAALRELRVFELLPTARALHPQLRPSSSVEDVLRAYGLPAALSDSVAMPSYEDILWAVVARASAEGLAWPDLIDAVNRVRRPVSFERYDFDAATLSAVPPAPGVYLMCDDAGSVIYVGKSANLNRRLNEYFRPARELPEKVQAIRARIRRFEYHLVGSELEALLTENDCIARLQPGVNVQRRVMEGSSRYAAPLMPIAVLCPSLKPRSLELFLFGAHNRAVQARVSAGRPPVKRLAALLDRYLAGERRMRVPAGVRDWGPEGQEVCRRYVGRFRDTLQWIELAAGARPGAYTEPLLRVIRLCAEREIEPGEFRMGET